MAKYFIRKTAALLVAFSLPVCLAVLPTIDRHDALLEQQQGLDLIQWQEAMKRIEAEQAEYDSALEAAMLTRNNRGDYGEVYE